MVIPMVIPMDSTVPIGIRIGIAIGIGIGSVETVLHIIIEPNFIGIGIRIGVGIGVGQWRHTIRKTWAYLNICSILETHSVLSFHSRCKMQISPPSHTKAPFLLLKSIDEIFMGYSNYHTALILKTRQSFTKPTKKSRGLKNNLVKLPLNLR